MHFSRRKYSGFLEVRDTISSNKPIIELKFNFAEPIYDSIVLKVSPSEFNDAEEISIDYASAVLGQYLEEAIEIYKRNMQDKRKVYTFVYQAQQIINLH